MNSETNFRILVIDDNPAIHQDFIKILTTNAKSKNLGNLEAELFGSETTAAKPISLPQFQIDTATQGQEGVIAIQKALEDKNPYALAFVDIRMPPGWDGIETIQHIWEIDKDMQVVICTAHSDYTWEETVQQLGTSDNLLILKKPFDNVAVRQLACALTKKWQLMYESKMNTLILERKVQERTEKLKHQATHDTLTGLPNRVLLHDRILQTMARAKRNGTLMAVLFFDLDRFKLINDSLSHQAGDELLVAVANRLSSALRTDDTISRLGGDEFVMLASLPNNEESVIVFASKFLSLLHKPFKVMGRELFITASIGISLYPQDGGNTDELLRTADLAMYHAKGLGGNQIQFYTDALNDKALIRLEQEAELRRAIEHHEFTLYFQPQLDVLTDQVMSVEALIRWQHPTKGLILPMDFIPLAEESNLIVPIGEWVIKTACKQIKEWHDAGFPKISVAVNVTTAQFQQENFVSKVKHILETTKLDPQYLEIEVTENVMLSNANLVQVINELKANGVQIVLDDFGTGNSSLSYLRKVPVDRLKIDKSFVQGINGDGDNNDTVIVQAIIAMAHSLNLNVVAEGIETATQLNFLKDQKCEDVQGFYISRPLAPADLEQFLRK